MNEFLQSYPWTIALFLGLSWFGLVYAVAWGSGWRSLSNLWAAPPELQVARRRFKSGLLGGSTRYESVLITGASKQGLFLHVLLPFRFGHKAVLIPWREMELELPGQTSLVSLKCSNGYYFSLHRTELDELLDIAEEAGSEVAHLRNRRNRTNN